MLLSRTQAMHVSDDTDLCFCAGIVNPRMAHYISNNQSVLCKAKRSSESFGHVAISVLTRWLIRARVDFSWEMCPPGIVCTCLFLVSVDTGLDLGDLGTIRTKEEKESGVLIQRSVP